MDSWDPTGPGVLTLPSGRLVRGRSLGRPPPLGEPPQFAVHLLSTEPAPVPWEVRWVRWPDFGLPVDPDALRSALHEAWVRAVDRRVELACSGGRGRTGTALACLAVLDGVPRRDAVTYVRRHYRRLAVETRGQKRYVESFSWP